VYQYKLNKLAKVSKGNAEKFIDYTLTPTEKYKVAQTLDGWHMLRRDSLCRSERHPMESLELRDVPHLVT
jgi:hypothetical protein